MGAHILFCIKGVFCLENKSISPNLTPYLISGPNVALICLKAEAEGSLCVCKCSPIPWLSSAPVNLGLVLQSRPWPSKPHCMPEPLLWVWLLFIYPPRMFPQQFWQLRTAEQTSWPLRMGIVLSKSSSSHSHISRNDNEKASEQIAA